MITEERADALTGAFEKWEVALRRHTDTQIQIFELDAALKDRRADVITGYVGNEKAMGANAEAREAFVAREWLSLMRLIYGQDAQGGQGH